MLLAIKVAKLNSVIEFDTAKLPESSTTYAMTYGITQAINDAHASVMRKNYPEGADGDTKYLADVQAKVAKRVEQIESGNVPGSRAPADPNATAGRALARRLGDQAQVLQSMSDDELAKVIAQLEKARAKKSAA